MGRIELRTLIAAPIERYFDLSRDLDLHLESMKASSKRAVAGKTSGLIGVGEWVTWEARHFGRTWRVTSRITEMNPPRMFVDEMEEGPFACFRHEHEFTPRDGGTLMIDRVDFAAPFGLLGKVADVLLVKRYLQRLLALRNLEITKRAVTT
jgi:ligand-binding SRPBCC domain-containing protein